VKGLLELKVRLVMKPRLAIIVGHSKKSPGAVSDDGLTEYLYNSGVAQNMWEYAEKYPEIEVEIFLRDNSTIVGVAKEVNAWVKDAPKSLALELHCNSSDNETAHGTEVVYELIPTVNRFLAKRFQSALHELFQSKDRGTRLLNPGDRGFPSMGSIACPSLLIEPAFLSHQNDVNMLRLKQHAYSEVLLECALEYLIGE